MTGTRLTFTHTDGTFTYANVGDGHEFSEWAIRPYAIVLWRPDRTRRYVHPGSITSLDVQPGGVA